MIAALLALVPLGAAAPDATAPFVEVGRWPAGWIVANEHVLAAIAPDGTAVASLDGSGALRLGDASGQRRLATLSSVRYARRLAFSEDGRALALVDGHEITVRAVPSGAVMLKETVQGADAAWEEGALWLSEVEGGPARWRWAPGAPSFEPIRAPVPRTSSVRIGALSSSLSVRGRQASVPVPYRGHERYESGLPNALSVVSWSLWDADRPDEPELPLSRDCPAPEPPPSLPLVSAMPRALSEDGALGFGGAVALCAWDLQTGELRYVRDDLSGRAHGLPVSVRGDLLLVGADRPDNANLPRWLALDAASGQTRYEVPFAWEAVPGPEPGTTLAWSADQTGLVDASGAERWRHTTPRPHPGLGERVRVLVSPDAHTLAAHHWREEHDVALFDAASGRPLGWMARAEVRAFSADGQSVLVESSGGLSAVSIAALGERPPQGHADRALGLAVDSEGRAWTAGLDGEVWRWAPGEEGVRVLQTGLRIGQIEVVGDRPTLAAWNTDWSGHPRGPQAVWSYDGQSPSVWHPRSPDVLQLLSDPSLALTIDGRRGGVWDVRTGRRQQRLPRALLAERSGRSRTGVVLDAAGRFAAALPAYAPHPGEDSSSVLGAFTRGRPRLCSFSCGSPRDVAVSADGTELWVAGRDRLCRFDVATGARLLALAYEAALGVTLAPEGGPVAVVTSDGVDLLDRTDGSLLQRLEPESGSVSHTAFSADGRSLAVSSEHAVTLFTRP